MPIDRKAFEIALKRVRPAVAVTDFLPQLTHFKFTPDDVGAFDGKKGIVVPFKTGVDCLIPADRFWDVISSMSQTEINLAIEGESLILTAHKHKSKYPIRPASDLPVFRHKDPPETWPAVPDDFKTALELCLPFTGDSGVRPDLAGISVFGEDVLSCDQKRVAWYTLKAPIIMDAPILLATDLVREVIRLGTPNHMIFDAKSAAFAYADGSQVLGALVAEKFPENMARFFPDLEKTATISSAGAKSIASLLERVGKFTEKGDVEARSTLEFFSGGVRSSFQDEVSQIEDSIEDLPFDVGAVKLNVNPYHVAEALKLTNQIAIFKPGGEAEVGMALYFRSEDGKFQLITGCEAKTEPQAETTK